MSDRPRLGIATASDPYGIIIPDGGTTPKSGSSTHNTNAFFNGSDPAGGLSIPQRLDLAPPYLPASMSPSSSLRKNSVRTAASANARPLRSQYPADSNKSHVEFILVASFDIDRGPIMEHQYPGQISGDQSMLAELMLPDQAHNRTQDWTIFFLHKDEEDSDQESNKPRRRKRNQQGRANGTGDHEDNEAPSSTTEEDEDEENEAEEEEEEEEDDGKALEGPPLIYVLNLVNTKHDPSVKRGAICKAMAICTRHPFLHIYKPLLLLALEEYFKNPVPETLQTLYESVNAMDLTLMPRLTLLERIILQSSSDKDLFVGKFQRMIEQRQAEEKYPQIGVEPSGRWALPRDTHELESKIMYNGIQVPVKIPTAKDLEAVGDFSLIKLIQTFSNPHTASPQAFTLHPHLTTSGAFTHPIIVLVNALLTQKRIIFLGLNRPSGEVAEAVLAACALASGGLLRGFTRHAFPYTDLTKIDELLKVPGFIAGVTNSVFKQHPEWWDLLCDLPSGRMEISSRIETPPVTEGLLAFQQQNPTSSTNSNQQTAKNQDATGDAVFMESVLRNITNRLGEGVIRAMWRDWIVKLTRIAAAFEESVYGASALYIGGEEADAGSFGVKGHGYVWTDEATRQKEMASQVNRIEGWRNTRSYYVLIQDLAHFYTSRPISSMDLHYQHDRLRSLKLAKDESAAIYLSFERAIHTPAEICQLLTVTPESHGGLFYLSLGLLHPQHVVRCRTVDLLDRIREHEAGSHFWDNLNRFAKLAFLRIKRELEADTKDEDNNENVFIGNIRTS